IDGWRVGTTLKVFANSQSVGAFAGKNDSRGCNSHIGRAAQDWLAMNMKPRVSIALGFFLLAWLARAQPTNAPASGVNLALVATPSSSYVSGDTRNSALNDGFNPRSSRDNRRGSYGNWPRQGTQWVQYEWTQPISTRQAEVYWWDDQQGVRLPKAVRLKYWDGKKLVAVQNASGQGVTGDKFNETTFDE